MPYILRTASASAHIGNMRDVQELINAARDGGAPLDAGVEWDTDHDTMVVEWVESED